jgi:hypothetical protein
MRPLQGAGVTGTAMSMALLDPVPSQPESAVRVPRRMDWF